MVLTETKKRIAMIAIAALTIMVSAAFIMPGNIANARTITGDQIIMQAKKYCRSNYYYDYAAPVQRFTKNTKTGIDCSGLVASVMRDLGQSKWKKTRTYKPWHESAACWKGMRKMVYPAGKCHSPAGNLKGETALKKAAPGDVIAWKSHWIGKSDHKKFAHVGFYAGKKNGIYYVIDSYPWRYQHEKSSTAGAKKSGCGKKYRGVNYRPMNKTEIKRITHITRLQKETNPTTQSR